MAVKAFYSKCVVCGGRVLEATVLVEHGKILSVQQGKPPAFAGELIDAGDKVLMAGVVDPHVHINEPGRADWEGFDTATRAAIAGGVTSLVEMPLNASPVTTTVEAYRQKLAATAGKLHTNCGFWGGIIPGNAGEIIPMAKAGVLGFKAFLTHSGIDEFPNVTEHDLDIAMPMVAATGLPLLVHCELSDSKVKMLHSNPSSYRQYLASRPAYWEEEAIAMILRLAEKYGCRVHIVHLSAAGALPAIRAAKEAGVAVTVETAQHYLYFNAETIPDGNTAFKCAPPIREKKNNERLWAALKERLVDFVATDHSPAPPAMKQVASGDLTSAWGGIASIQLALPALWTAGQRHGISLVQLAQWLCEQPATLAGLQDRKGRIEGGLDADLVIWDPAAAFTVDGALLHHRHKITPYHDELMLGKVYQTYLAGEKVFDNDIFTALNKGQILS